MFKSILGLFAVVTMLTACADISDDLPEAAGAAGEAGAAGAAGAAGNSNVVPPGSGGSAGASTGGSAGEAGSSNPVLPDAGTAGEAGSAPSGDAGTVCAGEACEFGHSSACVQGENVYLCSCLDIYLPAGVSISCDDAGTAGSGGSGGSTGGSGGSGGNSNPVLPDAGTGGTSSTGGSGGSTGTVCAGATCVYGSAATCVQSGVTYTCSCLGIYLPQGSNVVCSDAGTGGSGGTGGSSGSGGAGGTGGTTSTGGSGGTAGTGGSGGNTATAGTMVVTLVAPTSGTHTYKVYAQSYNLLPGEPDWNADVKTVTGTRATLTYTAYQGSTFKIGGFYDPQDGDWMHQYCNPANPTKVTVAAWATLDGKALPALTAKSNGQNGCDLWVTATPLGTGCVEDADCDGYKAHATDLNLEDCEDNNAAAHPGQLETPDNPDNMSCSLGRVGYRLLVGQSTYAPVLYDWSHGGVAYTMSWNTNGFYETFIEKSVASSDFIIQYGSSNWNVGWDTQSQGSCKNYATVQVYLESTNTLYNTTSVAYPNNSPPTCHTSVTNL